MADEYDQIMLREACDNAIGEAVSHIADEMVVQDIERRVAAYIDWLELRISALEHPAEREAPDDDVSELDAQLGGENLDW